jgi:hypothetical protein
MILNQFEEQQELNRLKPTLNDIKQLYEIHCQESFYQCNSFQELETRMNYKNHYDFLLLLENASYEAYQIFFQQYPHFYNIDKLYNFIYNPSKYVKDTKFKYYFGTDSHLTGWNIIGRTLQKIYYDSILVTPILVYNLYQSKCFLVEKIKKGDSVYEYYNCPISIILKQISHKKSSYTIESIYELYLSKKIEDYEIIEYELQMPGNMALLCMKKYMFDTQTYYEKKENDLLYHYTLKLFSQQTQKRTFQIECTEKVLNKCKILYQTQKLKFRDDYQKVWDTFQQSKLTNEQKIWIQSSLPINVIKNQTIILSENNEDISPMTPHIIKYKKLEFQCIFHLIYYLILTKLKAKSQDVYSLLYQKKETIHLYNSDIDYLICQQYVQLIKKSYKSIFYSKIQNCKLYLSFLAQIKKVSYQNDNDKLIEYIHNYFLQKSIPKDSIIPHCFTKTLDFNIIHFKNFVIFLEFINRIQENILIQNDNLKIEKCISYLFPTLFKFIQKPISLHISTILSPKMTQYLYIIYYYNIKIEYQMNNIIKMILFLYKECDKTSVFYQNIISLFTTDIMNEKQIPSYDWYHSFSCLELNSKEISKMNSVLNQINYIILSIYRYDRVI